MTTGTRGYAPYQLGPATREHLRWMRMRGLSELTITRRRQILAGVAAAAGVPLLKVTEAQLMNWREGLTVGAGTTCTAVSHVTSFYTWAADEGLRRDNPAARLPRPKLGRRLPRPVGEDDLMAALDGAPQPLRLWLVLMGWCGLRCKEIALLRRDCIRENDKVPVIIVAADATKGRSERVVRLSPFAVAEVRAAGLPGSGWAFPRRDRRAGPNRPSRVSQLIGLYLQERGIAATAHMLRHRFGTMAYAVDNDLLGVAELMGHASPATTSIYARWNQARAQRIVEGLPVPVKGIQP